MLTAGGLSVDGSRLLLFGDIRKKGRVFELGMMRGVARDCLHDRVAL